jgi:Ca-activated chloride channel homolog
MRPVIEVKNKQVAQGKPMDQENEAGFVLRSRSEDLAHPVLAGVEASGHLEGVLFELTVRQTYRNHSTSTLEVVYSFPLPAQAVLLGLSAELGGRRLEGVVLARASAERRYEDALAGGDTPVLLETAVQGLFTANIGNLKPGEQVVLEVRFAQWLAFDQGRLRLSLPTTIAPRAGAPAAAGLLAHQVPPLAMDAAYPLAVSVTVGGTLASAAVECPTHSLQRKAVGGCLTLALGANSRLDRDLVLLITPRQPQPSLMLQAADSAAGTAPMVAMAAFQLPACEPRARIALKLLVDCSGSMAGDSMNSARQALQAAAETLKHDDSVSLTLFGSTIKHALVAPRCLPDTLQQLDAHLAEMHADLGSTDLHEALRAMFALRIGPQANEADVLLVTDGGVWDIEPLLRTAASSGHRIFAIGVGSAPAESLLQELAQASGGACEFATPGEPLRATARRMMQRVRQRPWHAVRVAWGQDAAWQAPLPAGAFGGDTLLAMAGFAAPTASTSALHGPARLLARDADGLEVELARTEAALPCPGDLLPRMAAARRLRAPELRADDERACGMALAYGLLGPHTHCVLVQHRPAGDKASEQAELHRVNTLLAAGWAGTGTVLAPLPPVANAPEDNARGETAAGRGGSCAEASPAVLPGAEAGWAKPARTGDTANLHAPLREVMAAVAEHLAHGGQLRGLAARCAAYESEEPIAKALRAVQDLSVGDEGAWLLLALWVAQRRGLDGDPASAALLAMHVGAIDPVRRHRAWPVFDRLLGAYRSIEAAAARQLHSTRPMGQSVG